MCVHVCVSLELVEVRDVTTDASNMNLFIVKVLRAGRLGEVVQVFNICQRRQIPV